MRRGIWCCSMVLQDTRPPAFGVPFGESSGEAIHRYGPHQSNSSHELTDSPAPTRTTSQ